MSSTILQQVAEKKDQPAREIEQQFEIAKGLIDSWPDWKKQFFLSLLRKSI